MKKTYITFSAVLLLTACNKKDNQIVTTEATETEAATVAPATSDSSSVAESESPAPATGTTQTVNVPPQMVSEVKTVKVSTTPQTSTAPGMNPPHGQPNHRCDIPVGVPLSTPPQNVATQTTVIPQTATPTQTQTVNSVATPPAPGPVVAAAPGMNPPHGQPGHRCELPVGAPLSSK